MIINEISVPLSEYCRIIGRIERHMDAYSATLSWSGEYFAGEEIIRKKVNLSSYEEAHNALISTIGKLETDIMRLDRGIVRFSEGDNKTY